VVTRCPEARVGHTDGDTEPLHYFVVHRDRCYDAECLTGVMDYHDLPFLTRWAAYREDITRTLADLPHHERIHPMATPRRTTPLDWILSNDVGTSSATIWAVMMGVVHPRPSLPLDPSDFGRCHRLLALFPDWRPRLKEVARKYPDWRELVKRWDELVVLYEAEIPSGRAPRLYHELQHIREAVRRKISSSTEPARHQRAA
jgi:hypothetical protein